MCLFFMMESLLSHAQAIVEIFHVRGMCKRPSWPTPTSTKAPKATTFFTTPGRKSMGFHIYVKHWR